MTTDINNWDDTAVPKYLVKWNAIDEDNCYPNNSGTANEGIRQTLHYDWKFMKEFDSPVSLVGQPPTHEENAIIGVENLKLFCFTQLKYKFILTKHNTRVKTQDIMLYYCAGYNSPGYKHHCFVGMARESK